MNEESFDRRLGALFLADAALAVPEGTSVRAAIGGRMRYRPHAWRPSPLLIASLLVVAAAVLLAATPAKGLLPFGWIRFGTVLVTPTPTPVSGYNPQSGAVPEGRALPKLTLAQAQQLARFQIPQPAYLPPSVEFRFAYASTDGSWVSLAYGPAGDQSRGMGIQIQGGKPSGYYQVPAAAQNVKVNGHDAVYWKRSVDEGLLSWREGDFTYVMQWSGLGISQANVIHIAESMG